MQAAPGARGCILPGSCKDHGAPRGQSHINQQRLPRGTAPHSLSPHPQAPKNRTPLQSLSTSDSCSSSW
jgi:hypothetical protein